MGLNTTKVISAKKPAVSILGPSDISLATKNKLVNVTPDSSRMDKIGLGGMQGIGDVAGRQKAPNLAKENEAIRASLGLDTLLNPKIRRGRRARMRPNNLGR